MRDSSNPRQFMTTRWSLVEAAKPDAMSQSQIRDALETLCRTYWYPLYAFVRHRGYSADDAQDLTQAFFTRIIETQGLMSADRERGRFRSYLLGAMKHFLANEWHKAQTQKRGGKVQFIEWDTVETESRYARTSEPNATADYLFDREWAWETIGSALRVLSEEMTDAGKREQFDVIKETLTGEGSMSRGDMAAALDLTEGAVKVAIHRLRQRFRMLLRETIAQTVSQETDLEDEMRYLVEVLRRS